MIARPIAWSITEHAAERYVQRIEPRMTPQGALVFLRGVLPQATLLPEPTLAGQQRWLLPAGNAVVVAKPDPKIRAHVAVTVLGPNEMYDVEAVGDVVEAFQRATAPVFEPVDMPPAKVRVVEVAPKQPRPAGIPRQWMHKLETAEAQAASSRRETERLRAHADTTEVKAGRATRALRIAVNALRQAAASGSDEARAVLAEIAAIDGGYITDPFCYPERFTRQERQEAAHRLSEQTAGGGQ